MRIYFDELARGQPHDDLKGSPLGSRVTVLSAANTLFLAASLAGSLALSLFRGLIDEKYKNENSYMYTNAPAQFSAMRELVSRHCAQIGIGIEAERQF